MSSTDVTANVRVCSCTDCGVLNEHALEALAVRDRQIESQREDIANLERDLRSWRSENSRLKTQQADKLRDSPKYESAIEVLEHWRAVCMPTARELTGGKRLETCIARLNGGYTVVELKRSCDGYALKPYVTSRGRSHEGQKDEWRADAELIFRDPQHVNAGLRIMDRADDLRGVAGAMSEPVSVPSIGDALSPQGEGAVRMARFGFAVFPVEERGKRPVTRNGLKDAKRDETAIRACWAQRPHLNVAVRTGRESGIVVLDVDGDEGWDSYHALEDEHGALPTTLSVTTPGGGQHFYFQHPGFEIRNTTGFPRPSALDPDAPSHLDIRGDGGYVVAPPSVGYGGRPYEVDEQAPIAPMPQWLLDLLREHQLAIDRALADGELKKFMTTGAAPGNRNDRLLRLVGSLIGRGYSPQDAETLAQAMNEKFCTPPLSAKEVQSIVRNVVTRESRRAA